MEIGSREVQSPAKDSTEMILLTTFNSKEKCDTHRHTDTHTHTHRAFASTVEVTFGSAWP